MISAIDLSLEAQLLDLGLSRRSEGLAFNCPEALLVSACQKLRDDWGYALLSDLTAIDWGPEAAVRFSGVVHVLSLRDYSVVRLVIPCSDNGQPTLPSLCGVWPAANWHEREAYDMFGITYTGHPDLRRILMWDAYPYHPLRKDFPLEGIPTDFPADDVAQAIGVRMEPAELVGGPFVAQEAGQLSSREPAAKTINFRPHTVGDTLARAHSHSESSGERMLLNIGPSHPTTHGVLRLIMELDGDNITRCDPVVGYLHRGDEKIAENMTYNQFVPYTDRLDYLAPLANNVAYALAVEKLAQLEVPPRCQAIRVLVSELARISSHLLGIGVYGMDAGAWTPFMYCFTQREKLYTLFETLTGARFTTSYTRIGGLTRDIPEGWLAQVLAFCEGVLPVLDEVDGLLTRNKIFLQRTVGIGVISKEDALAFGLTGANLRASGVPLDLRKDKPYSGYELYDFEVPIGEKGDCYDRYLVRMHEIRQSVRIVRQVVQILPEGAWYAQDAKKITAPPKEKILTKMEELIQNFILTTQGPQIPEGEVYFEAENPKGALGFFIVSKGGGVPYRLKIRGPSFCNLSILAKLIPGHLLQDITIILGSLDFVLGECDR